MKDDGLDGALYIDVCCISGVAGAKGDCLLCFYSLLV